MLRLPEMSPVQYDLIALAGGLDLVTPTYSLPPGALRDGVNFAPRPLGGYYRIGGYERVNGMPAPSAATIKILNATWTGVQPVVGETITVGAFTGVVCGVGPDYVAVTKAVGTVPAPGPTNIVVSATVRGTSVGLYGAMDARNLAILKAAAANIYRADITPVPGSGPIRGCIIYKDVIYAFRDNVAGTACKLYKSSPSGWVEVVTGVTLLPGGRYDMCIATFTAGPVSQKIYGCDGVNDPFQFDGTTFTQITTTGMSVKASHICAFKGHLFLSYGTSAIHSALGDPLDYQVINGAGEIGTSDNITGMLIQPGTGQGGALAIYGRNTIYILYGSSAADWNFITYGMGVGGIEFTMQNLADAYTLDDRGIISMKSSLNYGNFDTGSLTYNINSIIANNRSLATASSVNREQSQYRVFFSNGYGIFTTIANSELVGHGLVLYPDPVLCAWDGEAGDGSPISLFGTTSGHVMQNDIGTSFDGKQISAYMVTNININKQLRLHKRFRRCVLEVQGTSYAEFLVGYNFDWASDTMLQHLFSDASVILASTSAWDTFYWDNFYWDGKTVSPSYLELNGSGENIQLIVSSDSDFIAEFAINSAVLHYTLRRGKR
jgi:hypothetical protein